MHMGSSAGCWAPEPGWALRPDCQPNSVAGLADKVQRLIGVFFNHYELMSKTILIRGFEYVIQSVNTTHRWMQKLTDTQYPHLFHTKKMQYVDIMVCVPRTHTHTLLDSDLLLFSFSSLYTYTSVHGLTLRNSSISGSLCPEASESCSRH